jgi:hypothetical protein
MLPCEVVDGGHEGVLMEHSVGVVMDAGGHEDALVEYRGGYIA